MNRPSPRIVAVWRTEWLPPSETFIRDHVRYLQTYHGIRITRQVTPAPADPPDVVPFRLAWMQKVRGGERVRTALQNKQLARALRTSGAQLVHAHFGTDGTGVLPVARTAGLPLVVTLHGYDVTSMPNRPVIGPRFLRELPGLFRYAARFIAVSEHIRERAIALGAPPDRVVVHHTGIPLDPPTFTPATERTGILAVGRLVEKKGVENLLRAVHELAEPHRDVEVTIVGNGPLREHLMSLSKSLSINATFTDHLPSEQVHALLRRSAVVAVPSVTAANGDTEGLPTVVLEAASRGAAVVATRHAGIPETLEDDVSGSLVPEGDVGALTGALQRLLADPALRDRLATRAEAHVREHFDLVRQTTELEAIYDDVVSEWGRVSR